MLPQVRELAAGLPHELLQLGEHQAAVAVGGGVLVEQLVGLLDSLAGRGGRAMTRGGVTNCDNELNSAA